MNLTTFSSGGVNSCKVEDEDSGVDPEEGSDEISLSCLVGFLENFSN